MSLEAGMACSNCQPHVLLAQLPAGFWTEPAVGIHRNRVTSLRLRCRQPVRAKCCRRHGNARSCAAAQPAVRAEGLLGNTLKESSNQGCHSSCLPAGRALMFELSCSDNYWQGRVCRCVLAVKVIELVCRYASDFYNQLALGQDPTALTVVVAEGEEDCPTTPHSRGVSPSGSPGEAALSSAGSRALMLPLSPGSRSPDLRCVSCVQQTHRRDTSYLDL